MLNADSRSNLPWIFEKFSFSSVNSDVDAAVKKAVNSWAKRMEEACFHKDQSIRSSAFAELFWHQQIAEVHCRGGVWEPKGGIIYIQPEIARANLLNPPGVSGYQKRLGVLHVEI